MLPQSKTDDKEWKGYKAFFDNQFPTSSECSVLSVHISEIKKDIETLNWLRFTKKNRESYSASIRSQLENNLNYLYTLFKTKENVYNLSNCDVKLAQNPIAQNSNSSSVNNDPALGLPTDANSPQTPKKDNTMQYIAIGVGSLIFIASVTFFIIKRRNK